MNNKSSKTSYLALWLGVLLVGAFYRLFDLAASPLSVDELKEALAALTALVDWELSVPASSGLLLGVNRFLFWVMGAGDGASRFLPAVAGTLLPLSPLLFKKYLGRRGSLVAAALLAISPSLVFFSRTVSGLMPGFTATLFLLGMLVKYQETEDFRWLVLSGLLLGVGFAAGAAFYSLLLMLMLSAAVVRSAELLELGRPLQDWRPWLAALISVFVISTTFFIFPDGLGSLGGGLENWITGFEFNFRQLARPVSLLLVYEPVVLVLGLLGALWAALRGSALAKFLAVCFVFGMLFGLARPQQADAPFLMLVPLTLLAGVFIDQTIGAFVDRQVGVPAFLASAAVIAILLIHVLVSMGQFAYFQSVLSPDANTSLLLVGIALIVIVGVVALLWTYSQSLATSSLLMAVVAVLVVVGLGKAWELGHTHQADPRELWVDEASAPGVEILLDTLQTTSQRTSLGLNTLPLTVQADDLSLRWYLRDFANVTWVTTLQPSIISEAVITPMAVEYPLLGDSYLGMDLTLRWEPTPQEDAIIDGTALRWWLHRQAPSPQPTYQVVLWLRQDVALVGNQ